MKEKLFDINVKEYVENKDFCIHTVSSLNHPRNNSLMFVMKKCIDNIEALKGVRECLIFWPEDIAIPQGLGQHAFCKCKEPRIEYSNFFVKHKIQTLPQREHGEYINGVFIGQGAQLGENVTVLPFAYISEQVQIGNNVYIGSGVKLIGDVQIGDNVIIRENTVIGAEGLTTDRDKDGAAVTMPQLGGVVIENNVQIGANTVIAKGAIDDTVIHQGCKIDNSCFISHNVSLGKNTFVVGESIMFGSSCTGEGAYISGNASIRNGVRIGANAFIGMGAVVVKDIENDKIVKGNPAK